MFTKEQQRASGIDFMLNDFIGIYINFLLLKLSIPYFRLQKYLSYIKKELVGSKPLKRGN